MPLITTDNIKSKSLNGVLEYAHRYNIKLTSLKRVEAYSRISLSDFDCILLVAMRGVFEYTLKLF
jgi:hypothetical protein